MTAQISINSIGDVSNLGGILEISLTKDEDAYQYARSRHVSHI